MALGSYTKIVFLILLHLLLLVLAFYIIISFCFVLWSSIYSWVPFQYLKIEKILMLERLIRKYLLLSLFIIIHVYPLFCSLILLWDEESIQPFHPLRSCHFPSKAYKYTLLYPCHFLFLSLSVLHLCSLLHYYLFFVPSNNLF